MVALSAVLIHIVIQMGTIFGNGAVSESGTAWGSGNTGPGTFLKIRPRESLSRSNKPSRISGLNCLERLQSAIDKVILAVLIILL
jgi:hypothetical protein